MIEDILILEEQDSDHSLVVVAVSGGGTLASAGCGRQGHTGAVGAQSSCPACGRRGADSGCIGTDRLGNVVFN